MSSMKRMEGLVKANESTDTKTLCSLIYEAVVKNPRKDAIRFENKCISYDDLNHRSNQIAHFLKEKGVRERFLVGIYMERTIETVLSVLAILKLGAAYLPLDPFHPAERNNYIIKNSGIEFLLIQRNFLNKIDIGDIHFCCIDEEWDSISKKNSEPIITDDIDERLAYVIYTSGSTGKPKGIEIGEKSVVSLLESIRILPGIDRGDRLLSVTTLSFDISVLELFLPLTVGASLILANRESVLDGVKMAKLIEAEDITIMQATPVTWNILLEAGWRGKENMKILCGGEALTSQLAEKLLSRCKSLWNLYGPTETTIWSSVARIENPNNITIGRPVLKTTFYVLDDNLNQVVDGQEGTLYIGGIGLAKGYLNQPELTAQKFIENPVNKSERIYNTGDVVRISKDGAIQYIGRTDFQVKVRGFRIELEEIEQAAEQVEGVRQAIAIIKEDSTGENFIVLYYKDDGKVYSKALREELKEKIPEYMLPSFYVSVDEFPLTPNSKIDRKALACIDHTKSQKLNPISENNSIISNDIQKEMLEIWQGILNIDDIMLDDEFLDLGGHSLLASKLVAKVNQSFGTQVSLLDFLIEGYTINLLIDLMGM